MCRYIPSNIVFPWSSSRSCIDVLLVCRCMIVFYQFCDDGETDQFHKHHTQDTKFLPNTRNTNKEKTQSHTHKPIKRQCKVRKNPEVIHRNGRHVYT
jgi:phage gp36-like protein